MESNRVPDPIKRNLVTWQKIREVKSNQANHELNEYTEETAEGQTLWPTRYNAAELNIIETYKSFNFRKLLTEREAAILQMFVLRAMPNRAIARALQVSEKYVINAWTRIRAKLNAHLEQKEK